MRSVVRFWCFRTVPRAERAERGMRSGNFVEARDPDANACGDPYGVGWSLDPDRPCPAIVATPSGTPMAGASSGFMLDEETFPEDRPTAVLCQP